MSLEETLGELLELNQQLLDGIAAGNWETYERLCDPSLSAFEPESRGELIEGLDFHRFYFNLGGSPSAKNTTICSPHVRLLGEHVAIVCYTRLTQRVDEAGRTHTDRCEETRVWERQDDGWRHVHFHRSAHHT